MFPSPPTTPFMHILLLTTLLTTQPQESSAQTLLPECATSCDEAALEGSFGCASTDIECFCHPPGSNNFLTCVKGDCDAAGVQAFIAYGKENCAVYGYNPYVATTGAASTTVDVNTATSTSSSSSSSSETGSAGTSGAGTTASVVSEGGGSSSSSNRGGGSSSGLSTAAKAGIGVGAGVGGLILLGLVAFCFFLYRRQRRSGVAGAAPAGATTASQPGTNELDSSDVNSGMGAAWTKQETSVSTVGLHEVANPQHDQSTML